MKKTTKFNQVSLDDSMKRMWKKIQEDVAYFEHFEKTASKESLAKYKEQLKKYGFEGKIGNGI